VPSVVVDRAQPVDFPRIAELTVGAYDAEGLAPADADGEADGSAEPDALGLELGLGLALALGEADAEGSADPDADAAGLPLAEGEPDAPGDPEAPGDAAGAGSSASPIGSVLMSMNPLFVRTTDASSPSSAKTVRTAAASTFGTSNRMTQRVPPV